ncbi:hypothetical protein [Agriterribacter sp.]|uniref:hypothetical protein n=1 Tax=Agriterribacter sp. TaxID=2821509 RepID=UPI002C5DB8A1|nr:hypothetical protein [Agriterribacter sp.]HTN06700.1 hypothetical protein [Agriterribacter sp.]
MMLSKWSVSAQGNFNREGSLFVHRSFHIVYLDDHKLFSNGLFELCIKPFFPLANVTILANGDDAYAYIKSQIDGNNRIDLFITDINHPGLKGDVLIKMIRQYEKEKDCDFRIPIVVITMMVYAFVPELVAAGMDMVDCYFSKMAEAYEIVDGIEELLY